MSYFIHAESLIKKMDGCANNPENPSTTKIAQHIPCGYSMSSIWAFDHIKKHTLYRGKDCMKKFCTSLRDNPKNITDFEKKKIVNKTVNKKRIKITSGSKSLLYM